MQPTFLPEALFADMKRSICWIGMILMFWPLAAQVDTVMVIPTTDTTATTVPVWFQEEEPAPDTTFLERTNVYLKAEVVPEFGINEEKDWLTLTIKIPWREDFLVPYFPRGLLPAEPDSKYGPQIAWQRSTILPGLGQIYNGSGWKVPIFWAGYGAAAWWINYNGSQYRRFQTAYLLAVDDDPLTNDSELSERYDAEGMRSARNQFRQARDNGILILLGWHGLQVLEAFVDAHLQDFDVSEDLGFQWSPVVGPSGLGVGIRF